MVISTVPSGKCLETIIITSYMLFYVAVASRSHVRDLGSTGLISTGPKVKNENNMDRKRVKLA